MSIKTIQKYSTRSLNGAISLTTADDANDDVKSCYQKLPNPGFRTAPGIVVRMTHAPFTRSENQSFC